jgi:LuxR family transcriptional regulator, maltose regulon positive regulatory protein
MTETRAAVSAACDGYHRRVMLTPRERERMLAELANLRYRRDRLAAAVADENDDHAYRDGDVVRLNDRITELTFRLHTAAASRNEAGALLRGRADPAIARTSLAAAEPSASVPLTTRNEGCAVGEELTAKELEVLGLLATRLSRREIGQRLYVSLNTVKTHQRALHRKLGVQDRNTAVKRARALGLL